VPDLDLSLAEGDVVRIEIEGVGVLVNPVTQVPGRVDGTTAVPIWSST